MPAPYRITPGTPFAQALREYNRALPAYVPVQRFRDLHPQTQLDILIRAVVLSGTRDYYRKALALSDTGDFNEMC